MRRILLPLFAALLPALSAAQEQRFAFALPEMEGRISLGVLNSAGKLVRTLCVGAAETDFQVGLNGLIATWDGKDDNGKPVVSGKYQVRGYVVGEALEAEGVAYHFNDWIEDENSPRITRIVDFRKKPGGFVVLAKVLEGEKPLVFRFDQLRGFLWTAFLNAAAPATGLPTSEPSPASQGLGARFRLAGFAAAESLSSPVTSGRLAATEHYAAVLFGASIHLLRMDDGTPLKTQPESFAHAAFLEASGEALFVGTSESITRISLPALDAAGPEQTPVAFDALAAHGEQKLGASLRGSEIWESTGAQWRKLPLAAAASSISFGLEGTFWVTATDAENGRPFTGEFNKDGEFLRAYRDDFLPVKVCASTAIEEIAVLETSGSTQRLRVLSLVEGEWAIAFEKSIQDCRKFGVVDGRLVADAGAAPQAEHVNITLAAGGLTPSPRMLAVRVSFDHAGLWLETRSGLRLAFLASQPNVRRVALFSGPGKNLLTVYAGDDAVVAEYGIRGLGNIVEIDAGEIELP